MAFPDQLFDSQEFRFCLCDVDKFNQTVLLQMKKHCTTRKVRSDCAKAAPKFTLMLKVLSVIYRLVQSDTYATKRDIYYNEVQLYGSQTVVDNIISDISCMLKIPRISLYILSASKGCVAGYLWFTAEDGNKVYCGGSSSGVLVPITVEGIRNLSTQAKFILIMEKEAIFQRLLNDNFCAVSGSYILITRILVSIIVLRKKRHPQGWSRGICIIIHSGDVLTSQKSMGPAVCSRLTSAQFASFCFWQPLFIGARLPSPLHQTWASWVWVYNKMFLVRFRVAGCLLTKAAKLRVNAPSLHLPT
ncbi:meiotic recombination protein SPO11 [Xenopus laevis]|uniref:Meiotic recombination protein SPO11 n=1 Tax=Xenopus laevis TaxID=8355 RepID=A0A8J0TY63_XENLA|nr:meiotic recombination protein SPO11 [Xenopus laevis]